MKSQTKTGPAKIDMLDLMMRTALEGIGQGGLGHSYKALEVGDGNSAFRVALRSLMSVYLLLLCHYPLPISFQPNHLFATNRTPNPSFHSVHRYP